MLPKDITKTPQFHKITDSRHKLYVYKYVAIENITPATCARSYLFQGKQSGVPGDNSLLFSHTLFGIWRLCDFFNRANLFHNLIVP